MPYKEKGVCINALHLSLKFNALALQHERVEVALMNNKNRVA